MTKAAVRMDYDAPSVYQRLIAPRYAPIADALVAAAALRPGEQVLELGAGTGLVSSRAAAAIAPGGWLCATDLSAQMLEVARERMRAPDVSFALVLVVCAFFLASGALAVTRTRRGEIGTLRTLGWSQGAIFRVLIGELALIGLVAGVVGTVLSIALVEAFSLHLALVWTLLVLPLSVALACVAAVVPAWRAARLRPLAAVRPAVARGRGRRPVGHIVRLALVNLRRLPARTLVGAAGLAIGIAALTLLLAIERSYHGTLVGTLLGNALALQVRGADLAAIGLTIALAAFSVADVLYVNLRERAAEIVTLRSSGWSERQLSVLVGLEAAVLGLGGSVVGAALGLGLTAALLSVSLGPLVAAAALAALGGTLTTIAASLVPLSRLRRLTVPSVLAAE
jgi:ABC-type lipoprotein release transport system permease subunit